MHYRILYKYIHLCSLLKTPDIVYREGRHCEICITLPGCVNGFCWKEIVNGVKIEKALSCECETFSNGSPKYEGPRCNKRTCDTFHIFLSPNIVLS